MQLILTPLADAGAAVLPPDLVWDGTTGDLAVVAGSLVAKNPLTTAVVMLLFTDARVDPDELRAEHRGDRRGWPGDGFDLDTAAAERPLGSKLWLYRRHELTDRTAMAVEDEAVRALQPLIGQQAVATIKARAVAEKAEGRIRLSVNLYGRDGGEIVAPRFDLLWRRTDGGL